MEMAEQARRVISCDEGDLESVAEELGIDFEVAQNTREYWRARMEGRCVLCGTVSKTEMCKKCAPDGVEPLAEFPDILKDMNGNRTLISKTCSGCKKTRNLRVRYVLDMHEKYGSKFFRNPKWLCKECFRKKAKERNLNLKHQPFKCLEGKIAAKMEKIEGNTGIRKVEGKCTLNTPSEEGKEEVMAATATKASPVSEHFEAALENLKSDNDEVRKMARAECRQSLNYVEQGMSLAPRLCHKAEFSTPIVSDIISVGKPLAYAGGIYAGVKGIMTVVEWLRA